MTYFNFWDEDNTNETDWISGTSGTKEPEPCDNHCESCGFFDFDTERCSLEEGLP